MTFCADDRLRERELAAPIMRVARAIYDAMTWRLKKALYEPFAAMVHVFPAGIDSLARGLSEEADRGGLLASGSLLAAMRRVAQTPTAGGEAALRTLLTQPRARGLVEYALSKEYEELALALSGA